MKNVVDDLLTTRKKPVVPLKDHSNSEIKKMAMLEYTSREVAKTFGWPIEKAKIQLEQAKKKLTVELKKELTEKTNEQIANTRLRIAEKALQVIELGLDSFDKEMIAKVPVKALKTALLALDRTEYTGAVKYKNTEGDKIQNNNFLLTPQLVEEACKQSKKIYDAQAKCLKPK